ncbi:MAG: peptidoglycan DD-metalloendopeptidase family protein [Nitrospirae bacterium]|nr:peptidoglycan DD-metalloendopeptidase family protein [Nitrospirota bacterium]
MISPIQSLPQDPRISKSGNGQPEAKDPGKAGKEFESFFVSYLLKVMRESLPKDGLMGGGAGGDLYMSLMDQQVAEEIAGGNGLGVAGMIREAMERQTGMTPGPPPITGTPPALPPSIPPENSPQGFLPPVGGVLSSGYGVRSHPILHRERFHDGIDIAAAENTPVYPARNGEVIFSGWKEGYGNLVILRHEEGYTTHYAHNAVNLVREGDKVRSGEAIATVGQTGKATGPHLHFEIRKDGHPVNPLSLIA